MSDDNLRNTLRESAGLRLAVLFGSFCIAFVLLSVLSLAISSASASISPHLVMMINAFLQCVLVFCVPAYIVARFSSSRPFSWLCLDIAPHMKAFSGVVILYILVLPALNQIISWNENIHFPVWAHDLENSLRDMETQAQAATAVALGYHGLGGMLLTVGVVGVLTGFSEELFFRGAFQGVLVRSKIGEHASVWIAAFVFTTLHFQFFGFLPRLLMGAMFGYLLVWSKSIWVPVFAHALNNSVVVIASSYLGEDADAGINSFGVTADSEMPWGAIASASATFIFLWRFRRYFFYKTFLNNL